MLFRGSDLQLTPSLEELRLQQQRTPGLSPLKTLIGTSANDHEMSDGF
jgi:hypothetical protein